MHRRESSGDGLLHLAQALIDVVENSDDSVDETVVVPLNWDNVVIDKDENLGYIGIGDIIQISLKNDESGKIVCDTITVSSFSI